VVAVGVVIAVLAAGGIVGFRIDTGSRRSDYIGGSEDPNRVELDVTLQRVDVTGRELDLRIVPVLHGNLADGVDAVPARDIEIDTSSLTTGVLRFKAHDRVSLQDVRMGVDDGLVSNYPFDSYEAAVGFYVTAGDTDVPVSLRFRAYDALFTAEATDVTSSVGTLRAGLVAGRSFSSSVLAWFLMIAMWALALSVLGAALTIVSKKMGLVWPAMGWMAATLFALVGFRNAAPGSPPIGGLIDYGAFFWAELLTTVALVYVTVQGIRQARLT
jgi:hypothetical protein